MKLPRVHPFLTTALVATLFTSILASTSGAQLLLNENFSYTPGTNLTANGWVAHNAGGTNPIPVANFGLAYPGYPSSGIGFAAGPLAPSGEDDNRTFAQQTTGTVYLAALVAMNGAQAAGDYFLHLASAPVSTSFFGRVFARSSGTGYQLGLGFTTETPVYGATVYPFGQPQLVVVKYTFLAGLNNDQVALFVNPTPNATEPPPTLATSNPVAVDASNLGGVALRQGSASASASPVVDGIRVGRTWGDAIGQTWAILASAGPGGQIAPSGGVTVPNGGSVMFNVTPAPSFAIQDVLVDGVSIGPAPIYTFSNVTANHTISAAFVASSNGVSGLAFQQLEYSAPDADVYPNSRYMRCSFDYLPGPDRQFINVLVRGGGNPSGDWLVRNLYLPPTSVAPPIEHLSYGIPLCCDGLSVFSYEYDYRITSNPISDADANAWLPAANWQGPLQVTHTVLERGDAPADPAAVGVTPELWSWFLAFNPPLLSDTLAYIGCNMPNVDLDDSTHAGDLNGCVPASCANSMTWLKGQHAQIDLPPDLRKTFEQLSNLMNRLAGQGATQDEMIKAKLDLIEAYGLPIRVDYQSVNLEGNFNSTSGKSHATCHDANASDWPMLDWLNSEAKDGEDVELFGGYYYHDGAGWHRAGGHAVVVSGVGTRAGVPWVEYKDDADQKKPGGQEQQSSDIDVVAGLMHIPGIDGWLKVGGVWHDCVFLVQGVVAESYDASVGSVPTNENFGDYCQWIIRTIRPGAKLTVTYPHGNRCFNSTVWVEDRTVKPPVWRKTATWNFNSDSTRTYVNSSDSCLSVAVHNDDHTYSGGLYVPFGITAAMPAGGGTSSISNPAAYGGFSLGGADGSAGEFGSPAGPAVTVDCSDGMLLSQVPGRMGVGSGVLQLTLTDPTTNNPYWGHLGLNLHVLSVASAGLLDVDVPSNGFHGTLLIDHPGLYTLDFGPTGPLPLVYATTLTCEPGVDFDLDALGIPSLALTVSVPRAGTPLTAGLWNQGPNPTHDALRMRFDLPRRSTVSLALFDVSGARVATLASGVMEAGSYARSWSIDQSAGRRLSAGLYFCKLVTEQGSWATRIVIVR